MAWTVFRDECRAVDQNPEKVIDGWLDEQKMLAAARNLSGPKAHDVAWAAADARAMANLTRG